MLESTAEKAKELRKWYKANLDLNRNAVSVTKRYEGCLQVKILDGTIPVEVKDKIYNRAMGYEDIRRDEYSGEILCGANDFVFVYDANGRAYWPSRRK